jgi:hypothetical protein
MILMVEVAMGGSRDRDGGGGGGNRNNRNSGNGDCKGNLTDLRRILHLSLAKGNPK